MNDETIAQLRRQLAECKSQLEEKHGVIATAAAKEDNILAKVHGLEEQVGELMQNLKNARKRGGLLSYEDLAPGGRLADHVAAYTYFPNYKANEAFLRIVNWEDDNEGGGVQFLMAYVLTFVASAMSTGRNVKRLTVGSQVRVRRILSQVRVRRILIGA